MVVEAVVHLERVVEWLQVVNEIGGPICDVDDQFFIIKPDIAPIVDLELDLMQTDICELDCFHCDCVTLRDSLRDEVGRGY